MSELSLTHDIVFFLFLSFSIGHFGLIKFTVKSLNVDFLALVANSRLNRLLLSYNFRICLMELK